MAHRAKSQLTEIAKQAETGRIVPVITLVCDQDQIREAHRTLENGHASGKLFLRP